MKKANWPLNKDKSILTPVNRITFLGATWTSDRWVIREEACSNMVSAIINYVKDHNLSPKLLEQVRGYLNYYCGFAGQVHGVINPWLLMSTSEKKF